MKTLDLRRFDKIIALKTLNQSQITAFHSDNLEVAQITEETFKLMPTIDLKTSETPSRATQKNEFISNTLRATDISKASQFSKDDTEAFHALSEWNESINPQTSSAQIGQKVKALTLNVNQICNLKCLYCAAADGTYGDPKVKIDIEKTLPQLKFFLDKLSPHESFGISFIGGEPLLYPEIIFTLYKYIESISFEKNLKLEFQIVTNGTLLTESTLHFLRQMKLNLTISFDGQPEFNDQSRPSKSQVSTSELVLKGIAELQKNRGLILSWGFAAVYSQKSDSLINTYKYFKTLHPDWMTFIMDFSEKDLNQQWSYLEGLQEIAETAYQAGGEKELRKITNFDHIFKNLDYQQRTLNHCGAGKTYLMIDANNKIYTCPWDVERKENQVGYGTHLDQEKLNEFSKPLIELNNCQTCWAKYICGGGCMHVNRVNQGFKHAKDLGFCLRTRGLLLIALTYYNLIRSAPSTLAGE